MTKATKDPWIARALEIPIWWETKVTPRLRDNGAGCLEWQLSRSRSGYGQVCLPAYAAKYKNRGLPMVMVHRVVWIHEHGDTLGTLDIDHLCRNRACANIEHLDPKTRRENLMAPGSLSIAAIAQRRPNCLRCGLPFTGDNLLIITGKYRACRTCHNRRDRDRAILIRDAHLALGMSQAEYRSHYGCSRIRAREILSLIDAEYTPSEILSSHRIERKVPRFVVPELSDATERRCPKCRVPLTVETLVPSDFIQRGERNCLPCNREKARNHAGVIATARTAMGMKVREYQRSFGNGKPTATKILNLLAAGQTPDEVKEFLA